MQMLLCAATEKEISPTIQFLSTTAFPVNIVITGVGLPSTLYRLTKYVCTTKPTYILQGGLGGYFTNQLSLCDVVAVRSETMGDLGVMEKQGFQSVFDMGFTDKNQWPWVDGRLANTAMQLLPNNLPMVDAVTINEITTRQDRIVYYQQQLKVQVESMEGAALHYVAAMENIPFMQLRSLSNFVGERDKTKWNIAGAIASLNQALQQWIKNYFTV